jgi:hypothetical protein
MGSRRHALFVQTAVEELGNLSKRGCGFRRIAFEVLSMRLAFEDQRIGGDAGGQRLSDARMLPRASGVCVLLALLWSASAGFTCLA